MIVSKLTLGCGILILLGLCGCRNLSDATEAFWAENPDVSVLKIDEDEDHIVDFLAVDRDKDNVADRDSEGNIIEVPGTREILTNAGLFDESLEQLGVILAMVGIPFAGFIGKKIGKTKPVKMLTSLVWSVEHMIEKAKKGSLSSKEIKGFLDEIQSQVPGLRKDVSDIREELKSNKVI